MILELCDFIDWFDFKVSVIRKVDEVTQTLQNQHYIMSLPHKRQVYLVRFSTSLVYV